jgi:magnesium transporter
VAAGSSSGYAESGIFRRYPLLIAFQPVISAISGNVGLQSASINVRDLAVGLTSGSDSVISGIRKETQIGVLLGLAMGALLGGIACL